MTTPETSPFAAKPIADADHALAVDELIVRAGDAVIAAYNLGLDRGATNILPVGDRADALAELLTHIEAIDPSAQGDADAPDAADWYAERNRRVLEAVGRAVLLGYPCGLGVDPAQPDWPVVYIELPTGQVSWHLPEHQQPWDGHDNAEKTRRIAAYAAGEGRG